MPGWTKGIRGTFSCEIWAGSRRGICMGWESVVGRVSPTSIRRCRPGVPSFACKRDRSSRFRPSHGFVAFISMRCPRVPLKSRFEVELLVEDDGVAVAFSDSVASPYDSHEIAGQIERILLPVRGPDLPKQKVLLAEVCEPVGMAYLVAARHRNVVARHALLRAWAFYVRQRRRTERLADSGASREATA